jgi:hypothetical protein
MSAYIARSIVLHLTKYIMFTKKVVAKKTVAKPADKKSATKKFVPFFMKKNEAKKGKK